MPEVTVGVRSFFQVHTMRESVPPDAALTWPERMQDRATWGSERGGLLEGSGLRPG